MKRLERERRIAALVHERGSWRAAITNTAKRGTLTPERLAEYNKRIARVEDKLRWLLQMRT